MRRCDLDVLEIKPSDKGFKFNVGMVEFPRAAILIDENCPHDVRLQLQMWLSNGWFSPVAYVKETEYVWETLKQ
jgi:hypothetical protein